MFSCPLCSKNFVTHKSLASHTISYTKEKPYKCLICSKTFRHANSLKIHLTCVHNGHKVIRKKNIHCLLCSHACSTKMKLEIHLRKHSNQLPFSCNEPRCGFKTKYEQSLKHHIHNVHSGERPHECPSDGCSYKSKTNGDLKKHLKIHSNEKPFTCKVPGCGYACKMKCYLKDLTSRAHSDEKPFKCSLCDFQGKLHSDLIQHQHTHVKTNRFPCQAPNCGFASSRKATVQLHFDSKHRRKNVLCTEPRCNFRFGSIALLKIYLKRHKNPRLYCPDDSCSYSTRSNNNMIQHISSFHEDMRSATMAGPRILDIETIGAAGADDTLRCQFPACGFQTRFQRHNDRHMVSHTKEKKRDYVCTFCYWRFSRLDQLQFHIQIHTGEKPYSCSYCNYTAACGARVSAHARTMHGIQVIPRGGEEVSKCSTCNKTFWSYSSLILHSMSHLQAVVVLDQLNLHTL